MTSKPTPAPVGDSKSGSAMLMDLALNIFLPSFILMRLSGPEALGKVNAFALAIAIPFVYGVVSAIRERKINWISGIGLANILAAGALQYFGVGHLGYALKEALMPSVLALFVLTTLRTNAPFVHRVLYTHKLLHIQSIESRLDERGTRPALDGLLVRTTLIIALSFVLSAILNFVLAMVILQSPVDSVEFNQEFGKMTALSWPVIVIPSTGVLIFALYHMAQGLRNLTGLAWKEILRIDDESASQKSQSEIEQERRQESP